MDGILYISDGDLNVFNVERDDDDPWLNASYDNLDYLWNPENMWVFVSPRRKSFHFSLNFY